MTLTEATQRAKFFANYLFGFNIIPPIQLVTDEEMEEYMEARAKDDQIFKKRSSPINGCFCCSDLGTSVVDDCFIYINKTMCNTIEQFNSTCIHELLHYVLWWQGLDYEDGCHTFESKLKELGLSSNYDMEWIDGRYIRKVGDLDKIHAYEAAYQDSLKKSAKIIEKECCICGTIFTTTNIHRVYCDHCKVHPEQKLHKMTQALVAVRAKMGDVPLDKYFCEYCGKAHAVPKSVAHQIRISDRSSWDGQCHCYCCIKHMNMDKHDHSTCSYCGKSLKGCTYDYNPHRQYNYCSAECAEKHAETLAEANGHKHVCQNCGKEFINKKKTAYFCSQACATLARRNGWKSPKTIEAEAAAEKQKVTVKHTCATCKKEFTHTYKNLADAKFHMGLPACCSQECSKLYWNSVREECRAKKSQSQKNASPVTSLCATCKVSYKDCERMQTQFRISPKGAKFNNNGAVIECPKYCGG